jgi:transcriptional regulator
MLYQPEPFSEQDTATLHALIEAHGFAVLISPDAEDPPVSHLPLLLDRARGPLGTLIGHMARGNPHWQRLRATPGVLALFCGPHAYVSPSWYGHHPSVPTWNYAVVHAHATAQVIEDPAALEQMVRALVEHHETGRPHPWRMDLPRAYMDRMLGGIVGFELRITRLTGKFKLSQNRPGDDARRVAQALAQGSAAEQNVARLMQEARNARTAVDAEDAEQTRDRR